MIGNLSHSTPRFQLAMRPSRQSVSRLPLTSDTIRFGHQPTPQPEGAPGQKKPASKLPWLYSFMEGSAVIGALYGVMELTERNPEYFSDRPGLKLMISATLFGVHQLSHLGLFAYGYRVGKRAEKEKLKEANEVPPTPPAPEKPTDSDKK